MVTMGGVDVTGTVYHAATGEIRIEEVTGDIVITAKAKAPYTNVIDTVGTVDNVRLRSGGATAEAAGFASNYFPAKGGDIIRVYIPTSVNCYYARVAGGPNGAYDGWIVTVNETIPQAPELD